MPVGLRGFEYYDETNGVITQFSMPVGLRGFES